jgi:dethiobiotin synthase
VATPGLLLAGTDTGVGKTALAQGILRLAQQRRFRLVPYKPVETGCAPVAEDARRLCAAAAVPSLRPDDLSTFRFPDPVAPSVAARRAGVVIRPDQLLRDGRALEQRGDALLIESAGGLLTPYAPGFTSSSLSDLFAIDILLVVPNRLGAINHAALALSHIAHQRLRFAGLVLVDIAPNSSATPLDNATEIAALTGTPPLGTLRHCPDDPDELAAAVAADIALENLFGGALTR